MKKNELKRMITTDGCIDQVKLEAFIDGKLKDFIARRSREGLEPLKPEQEELYRCFLYCAITGPAAKSNGGSGSLLAYEMTGDIREVLAMADCYDCFSDPEQFKEFESCGYGLNTEEGSFFLLMNNAYEYLTGRELVHFDPGYEQADIYYEDYDPYPEECFSEVLTDEQYEEAQRALFEVLEAEAAEKRKAWHKALPDEKAFCEKYLKIRELYFVTDAFRLKEDIRLILD